VNPSLHQAAVDATIDSANRTTVAGAFASVVSGVLSYEFGFLVGIIVAVGGLIVSWYYQRKRDKREQAEHELRMRDLSK
jgi:membrane associated rhomboid family serine protease